MDICPAIYYVTMLDSKETTYSKKQYVTKIRMLTARYRVTRKTYNKNTWRAITSGEREN